MPGSELSREMQAFPRVMQFAFLDDRSDVSRPITTLWLLKAWPNAFPDGPMTLRSGKTQGYGVPSQLGDPLTDNSIVDDGYRFHDAFHIGIMAKLGWSPVMRSLLRIKRRDNPVVDEVEDGRRAVNFEESLLDFLGMSAVERGCSIEEDTDLMFASLSVQRFMRTHTLQGVVPKRELIGEALLESAVLFDQVRRNLGGHVIANLDRRSIEYQLPD